MLEIVLIFFFGASIGSFINVIVLRSISGQAVTGRSACPSCHRQLRWWELMPVMSFTLLSGQCARCPAALAVQYPVVELFMGLAAVILASQTVVTPLGISVTILKGILIAWLVILFLIDLSTFLLPDDFLLGLGLTAGLYLLLTKPDLLSAAGGALVGSGFLGLLWLLTKRQGIGLGDVKLLIPLGALFGWWDIVVLLWIAFMAGGAVGIWLLLRHRATLKTPLPFGPFLTGAAMLLLLVPRLADYVWSWWVL